MMSFKTCRQIAKSFPVEPLQIFFFRCYYVELRIVVHNGRSQLGRTFVINITREPPPVAASCIGLDGV